MAVFDVDLVRAPILGERRLALRRVQILNVLVQNLEILLNRKVQGLLN